MKYLIALLMLAALPALGAVFSPPVDVPVTITGTPTCTINSVSLSNNNFPGGSASGTSVGTASVNTTGAGCGAVSWSITGTDAASFQMSGSALQTNGVVPGRLTAKSINLVATITGATGSPFTQAESITGLFPGQSGFPVGYQAAGNPCGGTYTPHNTTFTSGTSGAHQVYSCLDVDASTGGVTLSNLQYIDFKYVRFQSNDLGNQNVAVTGTSHDITFDHVSITPRAAFYTSPPGAAWPSAGAGTGVQGNGCTTDVNCINGNDGYEYGLKITGCSGPLSITNSDIWGFGNAITFSNTTCSITVSGNWIHDGANPSPQGYHTDGPGYLDGGVPPQNVTVNYNTIASIGNTNALAFQAATSGYVNLIMNGNFLSGFNQLADVGHNAAGNTGLQFLDNTIGTNLVWSNGIIYQGGGSPAGQFTSSTWHRNVLKVLNGTSNNPGANPSWTAANDGNFVLPNNTLSTTDF